MIRCDLGPSALGLAPEGWTHIEFDDVPKSANTFMRLHYGARKRLREGWAWRIKVALMKIGYDVKPAPPKMSVNITLYLKRRYDRDNLFGACKPMIDGMKDAGLIFNDSERWLDLGVAQKIGEPKTVIEFRECGK